MGMYNLDAVLEFAGGIVSVFMPFILGLCIAFVTNVLLRALENLWDKIPDKKWLKWLKKGKRAICIIISELIIFGVIFVLLFMIIPEISRTVKQIVEALPDFISRLEGWWMEFTVLLASYSIVLPKLDLDLAEIAKTVTDFVTGLDLSIWDKTKDITGSIFSGVFNAVLGFAFSLYVLALKEKLGINLKKLCIAFYIQFHIIR